jgi:hypothetical protein
MVFRRFGLAYCLRHSSFVDPEHRGIISVRNAETHPLLPNAVPQKGSYLGDNHQEDPKTSVVFRSL